MIEGLKPYAESAKTKPMERTSEINIPWLAAIPAHWTVVRSKGLFTARTERARPDDEQLSATQAYGVIPQKEFEHRVGRKVVRITQHLEKRAHVEPGDFVISMRSFQGGLERAWARGCIRSSYVVLKPSTQAHVGYFAHLFKSLDYIKALQATSNFIRDGQDLNLNNFSLVDLPLPPLDEQAAIAKCLDHANRKIDGFIRAKRKLIALLNEQKQAIIHRAVTRGLDPDVKLKPSGIPWLEDIPIHWTVTPLKGLCAVQSGITLGKTYADQDLPEFPYLRVANVQAGHLSLENVKTLRLPRSEAKRSILQVGDVLMTEGGDPDKLGRGCVWNGEIANCIHQNHVFAVRPLQGKLLPQYLSMLLESRYAKLYFLRMAKQTTNLASTNKTTIGQFRVLLPPIFEQDSILAGVALELEPVATAITRTEREITLMQEYRTCLTVDIVTGKLDVREAAAKLPDLDPDTAPEPIADELSEEVETEES